MDLQLVQTTQHVGQIVVCETCVCGVDVVDVVCRGERRQKYVLFGTEDVAGLP